jgi:hypothetical protein
VKPYAGFASTRSRLPLIGGLEILKSILRSVEGDVKSGELEVNLNVTIDRGDHMERLVFTPTEACDFARAACDEFLELAKAIKQLREKGGQ